MQLRVLFVEVHVKSLMALKSESVCVELNYQILKYQLQLLNLFNQQFLVVREQSLVFSCQIFFTYVPILSFQMQCILRGESLVLVTKVFLVWLLVPPPHLV